MREFWIIKSPDSVDPDHLTHIVHFEERGHASMRAVEYGAYRKAVDELEELRQSHVKLEDQNDLLQKGMRHLNIALSKAHEENERLTKRGDDYLKEAEDSFDQIIKLRSAGKGLCETLSMIATNQGGGYADAARASLVAHGKVFE